LNILGEDKHLSVCRFITQPRYSRRVVSNLWGWYQASYGALNKFLQSCRTQFSFLSPTNNL